MLSTSQQPEHLKGDSLSHYHFPGLISQTSLSFYNRRVDEEMLSSNNLAHLGATGLSVCAPELLRLVLTSKHAHKYAFIPTNLATSTRKGSGKLAMC